MSSGGFVVVHAQDQNGTVLGTSGYLESGTHSDVRITLAEQPGDGVPLVLVAHRDTNENRRLNYDFENPGETDEPYPASGQSEYVTIEVDLDDG